MIINSLGLRHCELILWDQTFNNMCLSPIIQGYKKIISEINTVVILISLQDSDFMKIKKYIFSLYVLSNLCMISDSLSEVDESFHPKTLIKFDHIFKISTMFNTNTAEMKTELRKLLDMYVELKTEKLQSEIEASRLAEGKDIYQEDVPFGKEFQRKKLS